MMKHEILIDTLPCNLYARTALDDISNHLWITEVIMAYAVAYLKIVANLKIVGCLPFQPTCPLEPATIKREHLLDVFWLDVHQLIAFHFAFQNTPVKSP